MGIPLECNGNIMGIPLEHNWNGMGIIYNNMRI
jgi:hypothetical protein